MQILTRSEYSFELQGRSKFTCFTSTKVQILTPEELRAGSNRSNTGLERKGKKRDRGGERGGGGKPQVQQQSSRPAAAAAAASASASAASHARWWDRDVVPRGVWGAERQVSLCICTYIHMWSMLYAPEHIGPMLCASQHFGCVCVCMCVCVCVCVCVDIYLVKHR